MAGDHALEARVDRMKADIRARRKHVSADLEKLWAHGRAWWKEADKRSIAAVAGTAALVGAAAWYLVRRRSRDE